MNSCARTPKHLPSKQNDNDKDNEFVVRNLPQSFRYLNHPGYLLFYYYIFGIFLS